MYNKINKDFFLLNSGYSNYEDNIELPRHRWYYYKEGFSPNLVEKAIEKANINTNDIIIDPFNGSGTTTLTASSKGYNSIGIEVNPFTSFLSRTKSHNYNIHDIVKCENRVLSGIEKGEQSQLKGYSTFSKTDKIDKWLFNDDILDSFEGGYKVLNSIEDLGTRNLFRLALITAAMENCNAIRDGKCLRYRPTWKSNNFDKLSFQKSLKSILKKVKEDIDVTPNIRNVKTVNGDCRKILTTDNVVSKFKLCITSPPYLNTFDYTDIYRPELFLGKFINTSRELYNLRLQTVRSHIQAKWEAPKLNDFGLLYSQTIRHILDNKQSLMHKNIPLMVQAYFEDMYNILKLLWQKADTDAQLWLIVSNSAYAGLEVPVDLIIGDLGAKAGWYLKEIGVLRYIKKRKTKHSPNITQLRESVIIFCRSK